MADAQNTMITVVAHDPDHHPHHHHRHHNHSACTDMLYSATRTCNGSHPGTTSSPINETISDEILGPSTYLLIYVTVFSVIITSAGVLGNILVIQVVVRIRAMRTRMNFFLLSLSLADLLVLTVCQPTAILDLYNKGVWILGAAMCRIVPFLENAAIHCSVLSLLAISIERYIAICHPFRQRRRRSRFTGVAIILVCWAVSLLLCTPFLFMSELVEATYFDGKNYTVCSTKTHTTPVKVFIVADFVLCMLIPLVLLTVLYTAVIVRLKPSGESLGPQTATARKNRVPVVRMMVAVVALFYVCLLPMRSIIIWLVFESPENVERLGFSFYQNMLCVGRLLIQLNSAGNPIIYGLMSTKFRKAFKTSVPVCVSSSTSSSRHSSFPTSSRNNMLMRTLRSRSHHTGSECLSRQSLHRSRDFRGSQSQPNSCRATHDVCTYTHADTVRSKQYICNNGAPTGSRQMKSHTFGDAQSIQVMADPLRP